MGPEGHEVHLMTREREITVYRGLLILLAVLFCYAGSFSGGWLWDDDSEITSHDALARLDGLMDIWTARSSVDFLPVKSTFQWVVYRFIGESPGGWRGINAILHFVNCLLIWRVLSRLGVRQAWIGGLIFAIHPLAVCSVAWISELKNTLSLPLLLGAFLKYMDFTERGRGKDLAFSCIWFLLAMFTKASGVMFPFVLWLYAWWKNAALPKENPDPPCAIWKRIPWKLLVSTAPFFLISLIAGLSTLHFQHSRAIGPESIPIGGALSRYALSGIAVWFYLYKSILPFRLIPNYPRWEVDPPGMAMLLAWPAMLGLLLVCWCNRRSWGRHALFGLGFFLLNLVPVMGLTRMSYMRITWVSDHLAYLSLVGIIGLAAAAVSTAWKFSQSTYPKGMIAVGLGIAGIFAITSHRYALVYENEKSMWTYTLRRNPEAWQAHSRLSRVLLAEGNSGGAFHHIQEANRLRPDLPETYNNYAAALISRGDFGPALEKLEKAIELAPYADMFQMNLANLHIRMENNTEALAIFEDLVERHRKNPIVLTNYGASLFKEGKLDKAIECFRDAVALNPNLVSARKNLEAALAVRSGRGSEGLVLSSTSTRNMSLLDSDSPLLFFQR